MGVNESIEGSGPIKYSVIEKIYGTLTNARWRCCGVRNENVILYGATVND